MKKVHVRSGHELTVVCTGGVHYVTILMIALAACELLSRTLSRLIVMVPGWYLKGKSEATTLKFLSVVSA